MSTYHKDHPHYQALEEVLKLHLERYGEPWEKRGPLIQDILNTCLRSPVAINVWSQAWVPLFADCTYELANLSLDDFEFMDLDYEIKDD